MPTDRSNTILARGFRWFRSRTSKRGIGQTIRAFSQRDFIVQTIVQFVIPRSCHPLSQLRTRSTGTWIPWLSLGQEMNESEGLGNLSSNWWTKMKDCEHTKCWKDLRILTHLANKIGAASVSFSIVSKMLHEIKCVDMTSDDWVGAFCWGSPGRNSPQKRFFERPLPVLRELFPEVLCMEKPCKDMRWA